MSLAENKINLLFRLLLELAALTGYGYWGWMITEGWIRYLLMILFPLSAALAWGLFAVPDDPSRSGQAPIAVPGWVRLGLEWLIFGLACWGWIQAGQVKTSVVLAGLVAAHYLLSFDRLRWLIQETDQ